MSDNTSYTGSGTINYQPLFNAYNSMANQVNQMMESLGNQTAGSVNMEDMFQLQAAMNLMSAFGSTVTNVMSGVQNVSMSISHNTKGS